VLNLVELIITEFGGVDNNTITITSKVNDISTCPCYETGKHVSSAGYWIGCC
jgi:hypothetical protein